MLLGTLAVGLASHGYGLFRYPLYLTDEGIYMQRAWSTLEHGMLSPYTYFYDHAPGGWIALAAWSAILPGRFDAFGDPVNSGRMLMLLVHLGSVYLLFDIARRLSGGLVAPVIATTLFNLSPLAVFYQRMVLLDNLMVFWLLLTVYLVCRAEQRITAAVAAGLSFGLAVVTKENAVFFAPALGYLLYQQVKGRPSRRFSRSFYFFAAFTPVSFYLMYAALKGELFPRGLNFSLQSPPEGQVSLGYTIWWQLHRTQGSAVSGNGLFWKMMHSFWLTKDSHLLIVGAVATVVLLFQGVLSRSRRQTALVPAMLTVSYAAYLMRGSVLLDFYIVPLIPLLALNIGLLIGQAQRRAPPPVTVAVVAVLLGVLLSPAGGYLLVHSSSGRLQLLDAYRLDQTSMQTRQLAWVRSHVPATDRIVIDDDMWTSLHGANPPYRNAVSHWEASADPAVRDKVFHRSWRRIDWIVLSNKMRLAMERNNGDRRETWILDALDHHARQVWGLRQGNVALYVYRVDH